MAYTIVNLIDFLITIERKRGNKNDRVITEMDYIVMRNFLYCPLAQASEHKSE